MAEAEFDAVASEYAAQHARSIRLSGENPDYFARYKIAHTRSITDDLEIGVDRILDFGAGIGNSLRPMRDFYPDAQISCLDVSNTSLDLCRRELSTGVDFHCYDGARIPAGIGPFDLIFTACVFHHIPADMHVRLLSQILKMLAPGGVFVLFEHNPWNPLTQHAVRTCPFDQNAVLISARAMRRRLLAAGFAQVEIAYKVFFPGPLNALRRFEPLLEWLPLGAQYVLSAR